MKLDGLAGGHFYPPDLILIETVYDESKSLPSKASSGHSKPEHVLLAAPLGIASKAAGKFFIFCNSHCAFVELHGFFPEFGKVRQEFSQIVFGHGISLLFY